MLGLLTTLRVGDVRWVVTFRYLHVKQAGVHCATNVRYAPPTDGRWWEIVGR